MAKNTDLTKGCLTVTVYVNPHPLKMVCNNTNKSILNLNIYKTHIYGVLALHFLLYRAGRRRNITCPRNLKSMPRLKNSGYAIKMCKDIYWNKYKIVVTQYNYYYNLSHFGTETFRNCSSNKCLRNGDLLYLTFQARNLLILINYK